MDHGKGKIIAIVGAPRSGKSFLAKKLSSYFGAKLFLEGEEQDFPERIREDIEKNIRPLERVLWFRTKLNQTYLEALKLKEEGHIVILDVIWMSPQLFIDVLLEGFERELMQNVAEQDKKLLDWPDLVIFLKTSEQGIRKFIQAGGRSFDQSEEYLLNQVLPVNKMHEDFFSHEITANALTIKREDLDFEKESDFTFLIEKISKVI